MESSLLERGAFLGGRFSPESLSILFLDSSVLGVSGSSEPKEPSLFNLS